MPRAPRTRELSIYLVMATPIAHFEHEKQPILIHPGPEQGAAAAVESTAKSGESTYKSASLDGGVGLRFFWQPAGSPEETTKQNKQDKTKQKQEKNPALPKNKMPPGGRSIGCVSIGQMAHMRTCWYAGTLGGHGTPERLRRP